jgi:hypothetical protein
MAHFLGTKMTRRRLAVQAGRANLRRRRGDLALGQ